MARVELDQVTGTTLSNDQVIVYIFDNHEQDLETEY
jgi:hypothetical protein